MSNNLSIIEYFGSSNDGKCGYCKKTGNYNSSGFWAHSLTCQDYQDLINRNWRRSGQYCYKPDNQNTCCVMYTIKCDSSNFNMTRSQKKVMKRMNAFLRDGTKKKGTNSSHRMIEDNVMENIESKQPKQEVQIDKIDFESTNEESVAVVKSEPPKKIEKSDEKTIQTKKELKPMKAKAMRIERLKQKLESKGLTLKDAKQRKVKNARKSIEDFLKDEPKNGKHKLEVILVPSEMRAEESFQVYSKYQMKIHNDPPEKISMKSYERFLVKSPLIHELEHNESAPSCGFGSFHHQYYLDGVLIAVGVIDILPECVSSVYFYYDPDYDYLSLGTYASLREIALARELNQTCSTLKNYYLGFYIPTCPKMRYKSHMKPSFLLCPESFTWNHLDEKLSNEVDKVRYLKLNANEVDRDKFNDEDLPYVRVLVKNTVMKYRDYRRVAKKAKNDTEEVSGYGKIVGRTLSQRIVLYRC